MKTRKNQFTTDKLAMDKQIKDLLIINIYLTFTRIQ